MGGSNYVQFMGYNQFSVTDIYVTYRNKVGKRSLLDRILTDLAVRVVNFQ